jgi:hypothetical protein
MRATFIKSRAALRAGRGVQPSGILPRGRRTLERQVFQHAGTRAREPRVQFRFNLAQRRFGVLDAPLPHASHDVLGQWVSHRFTATACHKLVLLIKQIAAASAYHRFRWLTNCCKSVHHTRIVL